MHAVMAFGDGAPRFLLVLLNSQARGEVMRFARAALSHPGCPFAAARASRPIGERR